MYVYIIIFTHICVCVNIKYIIYYGAWVSRFRPDWTHVWTKLSIGPKMWNQTHNRISNGSKKKGPYQDLNFSDWINWVTKKNEVH